MRAHLIQLAYGDDEPLTDRLDRVTGLVRAHREADLVVLPELWPQGGFSYDRWAGEAQALDGPVVTTMRETARELGVALHLGSLVERDDAGRLFNTSVLVNADGGIDAVYRKVHLFGFGDGEPKHLSAGDQVVVHDRVGLATCYDLRFPELFRRLVDEGAQLVLLVAAWPAKRIAHWRLLAQARAVENQCYVVACNTAGTHAGVPMGGHSIVVDPWGEVLAEAGEDEQVLAVDLDLAAVRRTRESFPVLGDRRL